MATPAVSETKPVSATATPAPAQAPAPVVEAKPIKAETKAEAKAEKSDCRRFIPSAGVTISVRCAN
jgi:hypothetical protein